MKYKHHLTKFKRAPLWKWIVIIVLVFAMPLFFWFVRNVQMHQALQSIAPVQERGANQKD